LWLLGLGSLLHGVGRRPGPAEMTAQFGFSELEIYDDGHVAAHGQRLWDTESLRNASRPLLMGTTLMLWGVPRPAGPQARGELTRSAPRPCT